ncbi:MAG: glutamate racemase [Micavibrio sp.]
MDNQIFAADPRPIGVFDSGVGGLTVLRALQQAMPGENFIYLGDTARVPYGTKSGDTVKAYSLGLAAILKQADVKMIVIACNTASVHAAEAVAAFMAPVPVISMVGPAAQAAASLTRNKHILVMGTQATVRAASYEQALKAIDPSVQVTAIATQLLVALAEEGWIEGEIPQKAIARYIGPLFSQDNHPDTIILGCTHFPLLRDVIAQVAGPDIRMLDCGATASNVILKNYHPRQDGQGSVHFLVTDAVDRFVPLAGRFLGMALKEEDVQHIDLTEIMNTDLKKAS